VIDQREDQIVAIPEQYKKHRWKFLVFGAVSGLLMGYFSPMQTSILGDAELLSDAISGVLLWYILWWLWAKTKNRTSKQ